MSETATKTRGQRKERTGIVVSDKMNQTIVVSVERLYAHPLYKKYIRRRKKYHVHDEANECNIGDRVRIVETRPISKTKHWRLASILQRAK